MASKPQINKIWSKGETYRLIQLYEENTVLWDFRTFEYKDKNKRNIVLNMIAKTFDTIPEEVQRKLHNLKGQYFKELKKVKSKTEHGGLEESTWCYFDFLKFLTNFNGETNQSMDSSIQDGESIKEYQTKDESQNISSENEIIRESTIPSVLINESRQDYESFDRARKKKREDDLFNKCAKILEDCPDDDQVFGDYVAAALRNLNNAKNKKMLKIAIQKVILQFEEIDIYEEF